MRRWRTARILVAALAVSCAFSACGSPASRGTAPGAKSPDQAVSDGDSGSTAPTKQKAERRRPEEGLQNARPIPWDRSQGKGRRVTLFYYSGVKECHGLDHVEVRESSKKVVVTIFEGTRPGAEVCIELAVEVKTTVLLERPLGDRKLVDGS